jgi:CheY-like chemotaxis protein
VALALALAALGVAVTVVAAARARARGPAADVSDAPSPRVSTEPPAGRPPSPPPVAGAAPPAATGPGFLAELAHELRTPLSAVTGWVNLLRTGQLDTAASARALAAIDRNAAALARLIGDLTELSRLSAPDALTRTTVDASTLVHHAVDDVAPLAAARQVAIEEERPAAGAAVSADAERLRQVLSGLLAATAAATPAGQRVRVSVASADGTVTIAFAAPAGSTVRWPPVLRAVAERVAFAHGGRLDLSTRTGAPGALLVLGAVARARPAEALDGGGAPTAALAGVRVLLVDDDADARELGAMVLSREGAEVEVAGSAEEALAAFAARRPHVLVADLEMPVQDGYGLLSRVRALSPEAGGDVPAAALSGYTRAEDRMDALLAGFQIHVPKPVAPPELVAVVASLAGRTVGSGAQRPSPAAPGTAEG